MSWILCFSLSFLFWLDAPFPLFSFFHSPPLRYRHSVHMYIHKYTLTDRGGPLFHKHGIMLLYFQPLVYKQYLLEIPPEPAVILPSFLCGQCGGPWCVLQSPTPYSVSFATLNNALIKHPDAHILTLCISFPCSKSWHKWNHRVWTLLCLYYFANLFLRLNHVVAYSPFLFIAE